MNLGIWEGKLDTKCPTTNLCIGPTWEPHAQWIGARMPGAWPCARPGTLAMDMPRLDAHARPVTCIATLAPAQPIALSAKAELPLQRTLNSTSKIMWLDSHDPCNALQPTRAGYGNGRKTNSTSSIIMPGQPYVCSTTQPTRMHTLNVR